MCGDCYEEAGKPTDVPLEVERFVGLANELYAEHPTGGPLHVVLDDWNVEGAIIPYLEGEDWPTNTVELCEEIAALMNGWTLDQRYAAMARWCGTCSSTSARPAHTR